MKTLTFALLKFKGGTAMLIKALNERRYFTDFELEKEILFFKMGSDGLVSFHGHKFNRKLQLSNAELTDLLQREVFYPISSNCYINLHKIKAVVSGMVYFGGEYSDSKMIPINKRTEMKLKQLILK